MNSKAERYAAHVDQLLREHHIQCDFYESSHGGGWAQRRQRRIKIPPVRGQVTYMVALHEIGHVVGPNPRLRLAGEVAAWQWALDAALDEPTGATYRMIWRALLNYAERQKNWKSMKRPPEFDRFLRAIRRRVIEA